MTEKMLVVFLDANVFFAAVSSSVGGSHFIIEIAKQKKLKIVTVAYALAEAERNIRKKLGKGALTKHYENLLVIEPIIQPLPVISDNLEKRLEEVIDKKDIPIIVGSILSCANILITLDKKHILGNRKLLKLQMPFSIMTPGDFLKSFLKA